jgi:hypothetical protein
MKREQNKDKTSDQTKSVHAQSYKKTSVSIFPSSVQHPHCYISRICQLHETGCLEKNTPSDWKKVSVDRREYQADTNSLVQLLNVAPYTPWNYLRFHLLVTSITRQFPPHVVDEFADKAIPIYFSNIVQCLHIIINFMKQDVVGSIPSRH